MTIKHLPAAVKEQKVSVTGLQAFSLGCGYSTLPWYWKSAVHSEDSMEQRYVSTTPPQCYLNARWLGCAPRLLTLAKISIFICDEYYQLIYTPKTLMTKNEE